jgi:hypothetical protein
MLFLGGVVWLGLALGFPWKSVEAHRASQDESEQKLLRRIDGLAESLTRMAPEKTYEGYQAIPLELRRDLCQADARSEGRDLEGSLPVLPGLAAAQSPTTGLHQQGYRNDVASVVPAVG